MTLGVQGMQDKTEEKEKNYFRWSAGVQPIVVGPSYMVHYGFIIGLELGYILQYAPRKCTINEGTTPIVYFSLFKKFRKS